MRRSILLLLASLACVAPQQPELPAPEASLLTDLLSYWRRLPVDSMPDSAPLFDYRPLRIWQMLDDDDLPDDDEPDLHELLAQYRRINVVSFRLVRPPAVPGIETTLITHKPKPGQPALYLSRPAINASGDSAIVRITEICGGLCGEGILALMTRTRGKWRVAAILQMVFS